jgi:endonuclease/exonuclease/phosphatase family metal-dependent hydrolase
MKKYFICVLITLLGAHANAQQTYNVMTFNLRYHNNYDSLNGWTYRRDKVCAEIQFYETDILGTQENLEDMVEDLDKCLDGYEHVGVGRDDGKTKGEYSAIFIKKEKFSILKSSTFWLSQTPEVPGSKSWAAALTRICTWAKLKDKNTGKIFFVFNTHFDHIGKVARAESGHLIVRYIDSIAHDVPTILMGDLNTTPQEEAVHSILDPANKYKLYNTIDISKEKHFGPTGSFNSFTNKETSDYPIDHIFVSKDFDVLKHANLSETWGGRYNSDHFPVFTRVRLK